MKIKIKIKEEKLLSGIDLFRPILFDKGDNDKNGNPIANFPINIIIINDLFLGYQWIK